MPLTSMLPTATSLAGQVLSSLKEWASSLKDLWLRGGWQFTGVGYWRFWSCFPHSCRIVPDPDRVHDVSTLTASELERTRRELRATLALARPGSAVQTPIMAHMAAIDAELANRADQQT